MFHFKTARLQGDSADSEPVLNGTPCIDCSACKRNFFVADVIRNIKELLIGVELLISLDI